MLGQPIVAGHRGTGVNADGNAFPENTIPSFEQAELEGATSIELDVLQAADGRLVVLHDDTVDRTTDGLGCAGDMGVAELKGLDAAVGTPLESTGVEIPTLAESLAAISVAVNVEIKVNDGGGCPATDRAAVADAVVMAIAADSKDREVIVSSFDLEVLELVKQRDSDQWAGLISLLPDDAAVASEAGLDALHLFSLLIHDAEAAAAVQDLTLALAVWTENDPERIEVLANAGVDMIITDEPDMVARVLDELDVPATGGCSLRGSGSPSPSWLLAFVLVLIRRRRSA